MKISTSCVVYWVWDTCIEKRNKMSVSQLKWKLKYWWPVSWNQYIPAHWSLWGGMPLGHRHSYPSGFTSGDTSTQCWSPTQSSGLSLHSSISVDIKIKMHKNLFKCRIPHPPWVWEKIAKSELILMKNDKQFLTITTTQVGISFITSVTFTHVIPTDDSSAGRMRCACHWFGNNVVWSFAVIFRTRFVTPFFTDLDINHPIDF